MKKIISLAFLFLITLISCNEKIKKQYESNKVIIIYKENNDFLSKKSINFDLSSKDTVLHSKAYNCQTINDLFNKSLKTKNNLKFVTSKKFDLILIKKDTLLDGNIISKEFEEFLIQEKLAEKPMI